jgi:amino acid transporter
MKFWTDKQGNELTFGQFMKRWKSGIENITPIQKLKSNITGTRISLVGLVLGLIISIWKCKTLWWVGIILIGALINTIVQYFGFKQQLKIFKDIEKQMEEEEKKDVI